MKNKKMVMRPSESSIQRSPKCVKDYLRQIEQDIDDMYGSHCTSFRRCNKCGHLFDSGYRCTTCGHDPTIR